jgi:hypothetical protein
MRGVHSDIVISFDDIVDPQAIAEAHDLHRVVMNALLSLVPKTSHYPV